LGGFIACQALSRRNDDPATASRPFDAGRDGFVLSEGAGILVLEEYERAKARGAPIYAELAGCGNTADAFHITAPHEDGIGAAEAIACAMSIKYGRLHPTINLTTPDPKCDLDYIPNEAREVRVRKVLSNSFGFGGHNCSLALSAV